MFALEVDYLTGRVVASDVAENGRVEFPPHPGRLFSALAAAFFECEFGDAERDALLWLERQRPPALRLDPVDGSGRFADDGPMPRMGVDVFVPVNDEWAPEIVPAKGFSAGQIASGIKVLPERRTKQARNFPTLAPQNPTVVFGWLDADAREFEAHREAIAKLAANVTYLGHSSSLVRVALVEPPSNWTWQPANDGEPGGLALRVAIPGRLAALQAAYASNVRPPIELYCAYATVAPPADAANEPAQSLFGDIVVFECVEGATLPLTNIATLVNAVRGTLLAHAPQPPREVLSGHTGDGKKSARPHLAIVPLANIAHRYADNRMHGFALVFPTELTADDRHHLIAAVRALDSHRLLMGAFGDWRVRRVNGPPDRKSLNLRPYILPSTGWATVTPVELGRHPKRNGKGTDNLECIIRAECRFIGLPEPRAVVAGAVSMLDRVPPSHRFRPTREGRLWMHVTLEFEQPVRGPVILGAGRYLGMGLCRAVPPWRLRKLEGNDDPE